MDYGKLVEARKTMRGQALKLLGGKCAACGLDEVEILQIDRTTSVGPYRLKNEWGKLILIVSNFKGARQHYQLLCPNCVARGKNKPSLLANNGVLYNEQATYELYLQQRATANEQALMQAIERVHGAMLVNEEWDLTELDKETSA